MGFKRRSKAVGMDGLSVHKVSYVVFSVSLLILLTEALHDEPAMVLQIRSDSR